MGLKIEYANPVAGLIFIAKQRSDTAPLKRRFQAQNSMFQEERSSKRGTLQLVRVKRLKPEARDIEALKQRGERSPFPVEGRFRSSQKSTRNMMINI